MTSQNREKQGVWRITQKGLKSLSLLLIMIMVYGYSFGYERRSAVVETVAKAGPSVVNIRTEQIVQRRSSPFFGFGDAFFDDFFKQFSSTRSYRTQALGSGAVIDSRGYLVTNAHVVEKASKIYVAFPDEREEHEAILIGIDHATDLAVVKVEGKEPFPSLVFADADDLLLGETVIAIGNPLGLENSVTTGVVSAPQRRLPDGQGNLGTFIQTDALINPGNSGGPLLDINGRLLGINTAIIQQAQGIGFAIPVKVVRRVVDDLIAYGRVRPVYSGIIPGEISRAMARSRRAGGTLVTEIDPASPAVDAGIMVADVILEVNGIQTDSASEYLSLLRTYPPGANVLITLLRGVEEKQVTIRLAELPEGYVQRYVQRIFGLVVNQDQNGVFVERVLPNSPAARIEIRPKDQITEIDGVQVANLEEFLSRIEATLWRLPLRFAVFRGNHGYLVEMP
jgi:serine protease Do